jgi:hypothetical protein
VLAINVRGDVCLDSMSHRREQMPYPLPVESYAEERHDQR